MTMLSDRQCTFIGASILIAALLVNVVLYIVVPRVSYTSIFFFFYLALNDILGTHVGIPSILSFSLYMLLNVGAAWVIFRLIKSKHAWIGWSLMVLYAIGSFPFINTREIFI